MIPHWCPTKAGEANRIGLKRAEEALSVAEATVAHLRAEIAIRVHLEKHGTPPDLAAPELGGGEG